MPEYVYALHDFLPEHEDEVTFHVGERIEVVEKDDMYGDGWWQGRNLAGKVGLFPVSYTAPAPVTAGNTAPAGAPSTLQPLQEESESASASPIPPIISPVPKQPPVPSFLNGDEYESDVGHTDDEALFPVTSAQPDGEMMKATMTDVQKAIEQLGRGRPVGEDQRSFSFASTRDGGTSETSDTDFDLSDLDGAEAADGTEDWHKNARRKLAAKARRAVEEAEKLEAMMAGNGDSASLRRAVAPPIEVELSDESEAEDEGGDFTRSSRFQKRPPGILEEDENEQEASQVHKGEEKSEELSKGPSDGAEAQVPPVLDNHVVVPLRDESEMPTATAETTSFPVFSPPPAAAHTSTIDDTPHPPSPPLTRPEKSGERPPSPQRSSYPSPISPAPQITAAISMPAPVTQPTTIPGETKRNSAPFPTNMNGAHTAGNAMYSKHNSIMSSTSAPSMSSHAPKTMSPALQASQQPPTSPVSGTHPSDWTVTEVVDWLKSKGFDQDVCDKFTEQEITGDVLLELDANTLKVEIGIMAYGKRVRIANAIADLRRPPSIEYLDHHPSSEHPSPMYAHLQNQHASQFGSNQGNSSPMGHSRTVSQGQQSHHSFPGTVNTAILGYTQSMQSSLGSPHGFGYGPGQSNGSHSPFGTVPESPATTHSDGATGTGVGLGIGMSPGGNGKGRPSHLALSPSDGALKDSASKSVLAVPGPIDGEDRGHLSEGDVVPTNPSMRRRLFGRSHDSAGSIVNSARSRESPASSPTVQESSEKDKDSTKDAVKDKDSARDSVGSGPRPRNKRSIDGKHADRLSIFGSTFSTSLSKNRKPPPSAPSSNDDHPTEKSSSKFSLPKLHGTSIRKSSSNSHRPTTPTTSPKDFNANTKESPVKEKDTDDKSGRSTLRKRTTSTPHTNAASAASPNGTGNAPHGPPGINGLNGPIKQGQSILEQIGDADHVGWMRKRGERYNTWKLRYFVLKGPHLYCLKSNSKTETRIKGYIHIIGYKVTVDENVDPGRYGFRIDHDADKTHFFSSEEKSVVRDWMKAIMKATIGRDYTKPVVSSCNIPTIPLVVAQAMNPAPRPPSPGARDATQKALRRENPNQLSSRDARVLMGLPGTDGNQERTRVDTFFADDVSMLSDGAPPTPKRAAAPPRPSREMRRSLSVRGSNNVVDDSLIEWANSHLPSHLQITDPNGPLCGGLALLRLAESIRGRPSSPPVPDSAFPVDARDDKLDGLFRLFDFLLDNDVKMGSVSINDVRQGKRDKIIQLLKALKVWEDKRKALATTIAKSAAPQGYMVLG